MFMGGETHRHKMKTAQLKSPRSIKKVANIIAFQPLQNKIIQKKTIAQPKSTLHISCD